MEALYKLGFRDFGLGLVERSGFLKRYFVQQASGFLIEALYKAGFSYCNDGRDFSHSICRKLRAFHFKDKIF